MFSSFLEESLLAKAQEKKILSVNLINVRDFSQDKHLAVDDTPYGGGAGMVLKVGPFYRALMSLPSTARKRVILFSPSGEPFTQKKAQAYSQEKEITLLCGRYEGIDARIENFITEKISLGPYVLNGGEVAAMVFLEAVGRLLPGFLGNQDSLAEETSFSEKECLPEYPQYTRPPIFRAEGKEYPVPAVLLSGNHEEIKKWREEQRQKNKFKFNNKKNI